MSRRQRSEVRCQQSEWSAVPLAKEIAALNNISEELAPEYLSSIGDTPELADPAQLDAGDWVLVVVRNPKCREIARIKVPME